MSENIQDKVIEFYKKQIEFREAEKKFEKEKKEFIKYISKYYDDNNIESKLKVSIGLSGHKFIVLNKIQKTKINFDTDKLRKALGKEKSKNAIDKEYFIMDINALISYLKECKVDAKIFKSFLNVSSKVNVKELERLEELGEISMDDLKGCYDVVLQNPYFTIKLEDKPVKPNE